MCSIVSISERLITSCLRNKWSRINLALRRCRNRSALQTIETLVVTQFPVEVTRGKTDEERSSESRWENFYEKERTLRF